MSRSRFTPEAMQNYIPVPESGCWLWFGAWKPKGYGCLQTRNPNRTMHQAHRAFYEELVGPVPQEMQVCHRCDTPPCVNPAHLFLGTNSENVADKVRKGRCPNAHGERNSNAVLKVDDVRLIRMSRDPPAILASRFGVSKTTIHSVRRGETWRSVA